MRELGFNYVSRLHHICNCKRRVLSTLTLSQYTVRRLNQMLRKCRSKVELIQLGSAHEKYGVWTRPKSTREWVNKINLSSFQKKNFSKFLLGWLAWENQNILTSQPCLHTLMQTRLSANQSECMYYVRYLIKMSKEPNWPADRIKYIVVLEAPPKMGVVTVFWWGFHFTSLATFSTSIVYSTSR